MFKTQEKNSFQDQYIFAIDHFSDIENLKQFKKALIYCSRENQDDYLFQHLLTQQFYPKE